MGKVDVSTAGDLIVAMLREAVRSEETVRHYRAVLERFTAFLAERGLDVASDEVCVDFIANQTGVRLGVLREPVRDNAVKAVRRPVVLMADALAGRTVEVDRLVVPAKDHCPAGFRPLRDDYLASCRRRENAEETVIAKNKAVSRFLAYLDEVGAGDLASLNVRDLSGFFLRQRHLRRKSIALLKTSLADFLRFLAGAGLTPGSLADRLPPLKYIRHESEPYLWRADEIRSVLGAIDRESATGKRDYAMILATARLGLRISDLRQLGLGDLDWRAKTITMVQHKTGRPLSLPLLDDVGWAVIDYVRYGRPETACPKVFVKHCYPFDEFGSASSIACRLSRHAARAGIEFPPGKVCGMHSLRGALAVAMIGNGTPIPVVSAVLGHASSDTTQAYYLRFDVERLRCCALDVEDIIDQAGINGGCHV